MAYDQDLADRIREQLAGHDATEKKMFGGLAFLVDGRIVAVASGRGGLMARVDPADAEALVAQDGVERMVMRDRPMDGWLRVAQPGDLGPWVERGLAAAAP